MRIIKQAMLANMHKMQIIMFLHVFRFICPDSLGEDFIPCKYFFAHHTISLCISLSDGCLKWFSSIQAI